LSLKTTENSKGKPLVCIGFAEAMSGPEAAWSLVDAGFEVVAFGRRGRRSALRHSRHVTTVEIAPPESDWKSAIADLECFLASLQPSHGERGAILPLDDAAVWLCSQANLASGWSLAGPQGSNSALALDKSLQIQVAETAGLRVPETTYATTSDDVLRRIDQLPLVLKPAKAAFASGSRLRKGRNWICGNPEELERAVGRWQGAWPMLVQPFIDGTGEGVFGLATADGVQGWSAHRRLRMMNPHGSGSSACLSIPVAEDLKLSIERFIRATGWVGMFMIELLRDRNRTAWFVELNGRPWGSTALSRRQGLEYPAWSVEQALNSQSPHAFQSPPAGTLVCRNVGRECMHLLFLLRGPQSKAIEKWPSFWRTAIDMLSVRYGDSLYNWRKDDLRVFFSDWWYTMIGQVLKRRD
jgi:predicted ATP-grasp superfamily ATP-dependent carboligase